MKRAIALLMAVALGLVVACTPAEPTPTPPPEPTPTLSRVLATKPEHLAGIWFNPSFWGMKSYYRFEADGIVKGADTPEELQENPLIEGRFWFEGGVYYEESQLCESTGSYRAHLFIEEGKAVGLRFEEIDDSHRLCWERSRAKSTRFRRVD